jgi:phosphatidylinositol-3-phosphatase
MEFGWKVRALLLVWGLLAAMSCGGGYGSPTSPTPSPTPPPSPNPNPPPGGGSGQIAFMHVVLLVEENHSYADVIGNSAMPYLNSLATNYGLARQYYADAHPSIGNYFMLTTGRLITNDDSFSGIVSDDNLVRELIIAGKGWRCYAENLPSVGYTGGDILPYSKHHNPFAYFSDVVGTSQTDNIVPFSQFASDLAANQLADFSFIVPNLNNDAHDGTLAQADTWLESNIDPLITSAPFQKDGLLGIVFDEASTSDVAHGGGHVPAIVVSPLARKQYRSQTLFQHESTLRLILKALGITTYPGAAATAPNMDEFFAN